MHRQALKHIEYGSKIGKNQINLDQPFSLIREILIADQKSVICEEKAGNLLGVYVYKFGLSQQHV